MLFDQRKKFKMLPLLPIRKEINDPLSCILRMLWVPVKLYSTKKTDALDTVSALDTISQACVMLIYKAEIT